MRKCQTFGVSPAKPGVYIDNKVSCFFLYGPTGSGKTRFLSDCTVSISTPEFRLHAMGPYSVDWDDYTAVNRAVIDDFYEAGFISDKPIGLDSFSDVIEWIAQVAVPSNRPYVMLVDLCSPNDDHIRSISALFSTARKLEAEWSTTKPRFHLVFAGNWNMHSLYQHYQARGISFPYTYGYNFACFHGLTRRQIHEMVQQQRPNEAKDIYGDTLYELTNGHPCASKDILAFIPPGQLGVRTLLAATQQAVNQGKAADSLLAQWSGLPQRAKDFLADLLHKRYVNARVLPEMRHYLLGSGIVAEVPHGRSQYLTFCSWYVELLLRCRGNEIGVKDTSQSRSDIVAQMMPSLSIINHQAYEIVYDIENQIRNFVVIRASLLGEDNRHVLDFKVKHRKGRTNLKKRAADWKSRADTKDIASDLNPLVAYLLTRELAAAVDYLAKRLDSQRWHDIADTMRSVADIRDAVMHNQMISEKQLEQLESLKNDIYVALNDDSVGDVH